MSTDEILSRTGSDGAQRSRLVNFLETYRGELTWQHARELFDQAFPQPQTPGHDVLKFP